jgi:hypothetical protein
LGDGVCSRLNEVAQILSVESHILDFTSLPIGLMWEP